MECIIVEIAGWSHVGFTGQADMPSWAGLGWAGFGIPNIMWAFFTSVKPDEPKAPGYAIEPARVGAHGSG